MPEPWRSLKGRGMNVAWTPRCAAISLDHEAVGDHGISHGQRIHVADVDLVLSAGDLVVAVLYGDADVLEGQDRLPPEIRTCAIRRGLVEVSRFVDRLESIPVEVVRTRSPGRGKR